MFTVRTRAPRLACAHGHASSRPRRGATPAFVPLATKGAVKTLEPRDVAALGYEMVLGNTFHLLLAPGPELVAELGGLHEFMRWERPIITDSGGFQVFSMGHGGVADEIKGRASRGRPGASGDDGAILSIDEEGVRFRSYVDGRERFLAPETSMAVQAALRLRHRARVRRVHAVPRHARVHRALDRAHPPLARALPALARRRTGPPGRSSTGSSRAGSSRTCGACPPAWSPRARCDGIAIGGSLGQDKAADARGGVVDHGRARAARARPAPPPARDRRHRRPDRRRRAGHRHVRLRACPPGSAATAWRWSPIPTAAGASTWSRAAGASRASRSSTAAPCPACSGGFTRGLPALPAARRRADRAAAGDAAQPWLHRPADGRPARGDRRRAAGRGGGGAARWRCAGALAGAGEWCAEPAGNAATPGIAARD